MKGTNRVFIFVVLLLSGVIGITWQAIQTERFGTLLSKRIGKEVRKRYGAKLKFERFEFGLIPLATRVVNLELEKDDVFISAGKLGLEFGLRDIFSKDFSIGKVSLEDAILYIPHIKKDQDKEFSWASIFEQYKNNVVKKLPFTLRGVSLRNSIINLQDYEVQAIDVNFSFFPNILIGKFSFGFEERMFNYFEFKKLKSVKVNGIAGEFQLTSNYLRLKETKVLAENSFVQLSGKILKSELVQGFKIDSFLDLKKIKNAIPENTINPKILPKGSVRIVGSVDGSLGSPTGTFEVRGERVKSDVYNFRTLNSELSINQGLIKLDKADAKISGGSLRLTESTNIFDLNKKEFMWPKLFLETKNLFTNDFLFFMPELNRAKARISGPLKFSISKKSIGINTYEGFSVEDFRLLDDNQKEVLKNTKVLLGAGSKIVVNFNGLVDVDTSLNFHQSKFDLRGKIGNGRVNLEILPGVVDLEAFGPISGLVLSGVGPVAGTIRGPFDHVVFNFNLNPKDFRMLGFNLGDISGDIRFDLRSSVLRLSDLKGAYGSLKYESSGKINFKDKLNAIDMKINILQGSVDSSKVTFEPLLKPLLPYLKDTKFNYSSQISLKGGLEVSKMNILGKLLAENILIHSEDIERAKLNFSLKDNILKLDSLDAKKVSGSISGEGEYNLGDKSYSYRGTLSNLRIKDLYYYRILNLGLDGDAYGEFYGVGDPDVFSSRSHVRLTNSSVENVRLNDSILTIYNNKKDLFFSTSLVGGEVKGEGYLNLADDRAKKSALSFSVSTSNLRNFAGIVGKHNISNQDIQGSFRGGFETDFYLDDLSSLNLKASLSQLNFRYPGISISNNKKPVKVSIKDGKFENWNYELSGEGIYLKSLGEGDLRNKMQLKHTFRINSSLAELLTENVEKSQGTVKGEHTLVGNIKNLEQYLNLDGSDLVFKGRSLPGLFSDFSFKVLLEDNLMLIKSAAGSYGNGRVSANGSVKFAFPFPEVDLNLNVEKSRFPILKKSGVVVSGDLRLSGKKLPYDLEGSLAIIQGQIIEEMGDLASSAINSDSYQRFIPVGYLEGSVSFINTDILVSSFSPIKIKNGMIDLGLGGNLRIFGSIFSPKLNGEMGIENPENKFLFKGHEFLLSEGTVRFMDGARKESPELRFSGVARINDYDVYINLSGPADSIGVEMTSNPPLSQEDILSLLTLGVTSDVSKNLGDRQRQSVTTLSIGSLIIDQLKINQSLNDSLGLRLSIQPEFIEDENNLLEGRTEDRNGGNRFRSSTVLKVQKRISKKVNLSLSSTVGGSVDQNQEMNVNYKINKSWSLEGVYEVRSNDELEQELPDSVGADVKYQWSF